MKTRNGRHTMLSDDRESAAAVNKETEQPKILEADRSAIDTFIDAVLELVDSEHCPSAWAPDIDAGLIFDEVHLAPTINQFLGSPANKRYGEILKEMLDDKSRFCLKSPLPERLRVRDEIEISVINYMVEAEMPPMTLGLALGLRIARMPKDHARVILAGFLRNYEDAPAARR